MMKTLLQLSILLTLSVFVHSQSDRFYYFAYGSNLLDKRIHIRNPTAVFVSPAKLMNHRLDFNLFSKTWRGAVATIVPDQDAHVWGALWTMESNQLSNIDNQEGVNRGWYFPKMVNVTTASGRTVEARTYQETVDPPKADPEDTPMERRPSNTYMQVIINGAIACKLPPYYIQFLYSFPTNGKVASIKMLHQLGYLNYADDLENRLA